jgi:hypothetical protein
LEYQHKINGNQAHKKHKEKKNRSTKSECCVERITLFASAEVLGKEARPIYF